MKHKKAKFFLNALRADYLDKWQLPLGLAVILGPTTLILLVLLDFGLYRIGLIRGPIMTADGIYFCLQAVGIISISSIIFATIKNFARKRTDLACLNAFTILPSVVFLIHFLGFMQWFRSV